jgi:hypothetical protein
MVGEGASAAMAALLVQIRRFDRHQHDWGPTIGGITV